MWTCHEADDRVLLNLCQLPPEMVTIMDWNEGEPEELALRVLVETAEGSLLFARRVNDPVNGGTRYIDDQSLPIRSPVIRWKHLVAGGETP
jgi:hypothetical protein